MQKDIQKRKISVIVTIYNTPEKYLRKCIESIISQTLKEIEIILVNDGSVSEIQEICENYATQDNRIKLINQPNKGESVARNVGIENATTDNIIFVDSDDWIELETCELIEKTIREINYDYDMILFNCYVDYRNKSIKNMFYPKSGLLKDNDIEQLQIQSIEKGITKYYPKECNVSVVWAKVYNKGFIKKYSLKFIPNLVRMTDAVFNLEVLEKAKRVYVMKEYLYHYRQNELSICQKYSKDTIKYYQTYIEIVKKHIEKYNKKQEFKDILNIKVVTSIDRYMYNYYFHKDNPKQYRQVTEEFKYQLGKELYQNAMRDVKSQYLSIYQRMVLYNAKKKRILILKLLKDIKYIIKSITRRQREKRKEVY